MTYAELMAGVSESQKKDLNLGMFKAYDIRTKSSRLTPELIRRLMAAIGQYAIEVLGTRRIMLGRDGRIAAPSLMETALELLPDMGIDVLVNPLPISTCQFYFSHMQNPDCAAVMLTASHNPGEYIGLKLMAPGLRTLAMDSGPAGGIAGILAYYLEGTPPAGSRTQRGRVEVRHYLDPFIDYSLRLAGVGKDSLAGLPLVTDFLGGTAGTEVAEAFGYAGAELRMRNLVPDGRFPAGDPNPGIAKSIRPTKDLLAGGGFLCGICFDGDGDRVDILDARGEQLSPSFNLSVLLPEIMGIYKGAHRGGAFGRAAPWRPRIYADVKTNPLALQAQARQGLDVRIIRNGHSFIKEALREGFKQQFLAASEESAHYYLNFPLDLDDFGAGFAATENTLFFSLLSARVWAEAPGRYQEAIAAQSGLVRQREWPCHFRDDALLEQSLAEVEGEFAGRGLLIMKSMEDGQSLDATLMRSGLPRVMGKDSDLSGPWYQVAQRNTRSEEGIARWEVVANSEKDCLEAVALIRGITDRYVGQGLAEYL
jgi:phosphomannomutase